MRNIFKIRRWPRTGKLAAIALASAIVVTARCRRTGRSTGWASKTRNLMKGAGSEHKRGCTVAGADRR
jgi:hypothetical protein